MTTKPGFEEIPLDLSKVPTVAKGLDDAATRYQGFTRLASSSLGTSADKVLLMSHLPLMSFINRAVSLHAGIVAAVEAANPHAAFTLLRAYLELVALTYYVNDHPDYLAALERPVAELPKHTRETFAELFDYAAPEMPGIRKVYEILSEMAHFGSTALWHPFTFTDTEAEGSPGRLSISTAPHWRNSDTDPRTALAMLQEADEATHYILGEFARLHILPHVAAITGDKPLP